MSKMIEEVLYSIYDGINWTTYPGFVNGFFPVNAQKNVDYPFIVYEVIEREPSPTKQSPDSALDIFTISITTYSETYTESKVITNILKQTFDEIPNNTSIHQTNVQSCRYQGSDADYSEDIEAYMNTLIYKFRIDRSTVLDTGASVVAPVNLLPYILPATL